MCDPISIAAVTFAVGAGQAVTQHIGINQAYKANKQAANLNYAQRQTAVNQQAVQLDTEKSEKALDTAIAQVRSEGAVSASAADMGLGSSSIISAINADMFGLGRNAMADEANDRNSRLQLGNELFGAAISRESQIASAPRSGLLNLALGVGQAALGATSAYSTAGGKF